MRCYVFLLTVIFNQPMAGQQKGRQHMILNYECIGKRIKYYRTEQKISQEELSQIIRISVRHISNIETGAKAPSLEMLINIANALEVSADDLLTDNLKHSSSPVDTEIHDILLDCNHDEKEMLTRLLKFMKALFSEFGI